MATMTIKVCPKPWAETDKAWHLLTREGETPGSWTDGKWFVKSLCKLDSNKGVLTLPVWLYDRLFNQF